RLHLAALPQARLDERVRHDAVEIGGAGAVLAREGEEARPLERGALEELDERLVRRLRLAGEPDDERRPEHGVGLAIAHVLDHREEALAAPPSLHARA